MSETAKSWAVKIYKLGRGVDLYRWLCRRCLEALKAEGWLTISEKDPPHDLLCDGAACRVERATMHKAAA